MVDSSRKMKGYIMQDMTKDGTFTMDYQSVSGCRVSKDHLSADTIEHCIDAFRDLAGWKFEVEPNDREIVETMTEYFEVRG
jgi:hypothetical protein